LSDGELAQQYFAIMLPRLHDCLEQFPLTPNDSAHPLARYGTYHPFTLFPGTEHIAKALRIRHPVVTDGDEKAIWTATTDLLLVIQKAPGQYRLLALAFKTNDWNKEKRTVQLLRLEREFWARRGVKWLLITPRICHPAVILTLRRTACWALSDEVPLELRQLSSRLAIEHYHRSETQLLQIISTHTGSMELAQNALWQAIWSGELPIDLRRSWRPYLPLKHITRDEFTGLNPIASGRSSWI